MNYHTAYLLCIIFTLPMNCSYYQTSALIFTVCILPWHKVARNSIEKFNQDYPNHAFKEKKNKDSYDLRFKNNNFELFIAPQQNHCRITLTDINLYQQFSVILPHNLPDTLYHVLISHAQKKAFA